MTCTYGADGQCTLRCRDIPDCAIDEKKPGSPAYKPLEGKPMQQEPAMRGFEGGAVRNADTNKHDFEGFLSPLVLECYAEYMTANRTMANGTIRASDNWQLGIPKDVYIKSGWRHFFDWWKHHRGLPVAETLEQAICGLLFNVMGYLHEHLKAKAVRGTKLDIQA